MVISSANDDFLVPVTRCPEIDARVHFQSVMDFKRSSTPRRPQRYSFLHPPASFITRHKHIRRNPSVGEVWWNPISENLVERIAASVRAMNDSVESDYGMV